ncbi:MAG: MBL fold metallo-hydrolase [Solirubrobacteraceae bacterium]
MSGAVSEITYVGHATVLIQVAATRLLTDPFLSEGVLHVRRRVPAPDAGTLWPLDAVLISHAHHDHLDHRSLRRLPGRCPVVVPRGCASSIRRIGAGAVTELGEGDRIVIGGVAVEGVRAAHDGRRHPFARPTGSLGYLIEGPPNVYFAGDTDLFDAMSGLAGRVDVALVPIWGWGPRIPAGHLDPVRAAEAVARVQAKIAIPIHWGTLRAWGAQRGLDPVAPARAFAEAVAHVAPDTEVRILMTGQRTAL